MAINPTALWRVRPSGSNTNGGGYDPGISGAATDYSQQNAAQATGTLGTASGTATFTDAGGVFTAAMVGNALWIASGAGFTVGAYFVITFNSTTSVVLDRSPGTGTVAHWALGGGWADPYTNTTSSGNLVPGNQVFTLGSGTPNPSSYTADYTWPTSTVNLANGDFTNGSIDFLNDPATPGYKAAPDTTGGMPVIKFQSTGVMNLGHNTLTGLWFVGTPGMNNSIQQQFSSLDVMYGCVTDMFGANGRLFNGGGPTGFLGCEVFSSVGASPSTQVIAINAQIVVDSCNLHDLPGGVIYVQQASTITNNIIAKNGSDGLDIEGNNNPYFIKNNTIDGNGGHGIFVDSGNINRLFISNNIITNHTGVGKAGMFCNNLTATQNSSIVPFFDFNSFFNNTSNYSGINAGPHDTALGVTPYVGSATENYTLA